MSNIVIRATQAASPVIRPANSPGPQGPAAPPVAIQYSADNSSWHDEYVDGDKYIRFSTDDGETWGNGIYFNNLSETIEWVTKAKAWAENPEDTEVEAGRYSALHHAAKAEDSASSAATSASNAAISETNAATSAANAAQSEANAATSAASAATSETNAAASASTAATSETNAANSAAAAATSEANAATHKNKAYQWAEEAENVEVEAGKYSAYHWAQRAASYAGIYITKTFTAMDSQTDFDISDVYPDDASINIEVFVNGVLQAVGIGNDYTIDTTADAEKVVFATGCATGDIVIVKINAGLPHVHPEYLSSSDLLAHTSDTNNPHNVTAAQVGYINTTSGMAADNVQDAIDEIDGRLDNFSTDAADITYDDSESGIGALNVQDAIDAVDANVDSISTSLDDHTSNNSNPHGVTASQVGISDSGGYFTASDVEGALQELGSGAGSDYVTTTQYNNDFTSSKATNGYQKLPSGLIIQWTSPTWDPPGNSVQETFAFPISFPNACLQVVLGSNTGVIGNGTSEGALISSFDQSSFTISSAWQDGSSQNWRIIAIGY